MAEDKRLYLIKKGLDERNRIVITPDNELAWVDGEGNLSLINSSTAIERPSRLSELDKVLRERDWHTGYRHFVTLEEENGEELTCLAIKKIPGLAPLDPNAMLPGTYCKVSDIAEPSRADINAFHTEFEEELKDYKEGMSTVLRPSTQQVKFLTVDLVHPDMYTDSVDLNPASNVEPGTSSFVNLSVKFSDKEGNIKTISGIFFEAFRIEKEGGMVREDFIQDIPGSDIRIEYFSGVVRTVATGPSIKENIIINCIVTHG